MFWAVSQSHQFAVATGKVGGRRPESVDHWAPHSFVPLIRCTRWCGRRAMQPAERNIQPCRTINAESPRQRWSKEIGAAWQKIEVTWQKTVEAVLQNGALLLKAKSELPRGEFTAMVENDLPFSPRTAQRLMAIANNKVLSDPTRASLLPPAWATLYELSKVPDDKLKARIEDGTITPK